MFNCNGTEAGNLAAAHTLSDHMIPMDEAGTTQGSKRDTYAQIRNASYSLCSGRDRTRHPSFKDEVIDATFNTIVIFTSEHSPDVWASRDGEARDDGERARLIGFPAMLNGSRTIFDRLPRHVSPDDLAGWERDAFGTINECVSANCGLAYRSFTEQLVNHPVEAADLTRKAMSYFVESTSAWNTSPVAKDIIASFGIIYAGLALAIHARVLTFSWQEAFGSIQSAARAAINEIPDRRAELRASLALLRSMLEGGSILERGDLADRRQSAYRQADGFVETDKRFRKYVVRAEIFRGWFSSPLSLNDVLEWLAREGMLMGKSVKRGVSIAWAESQVVWPDGTRPRSIVIVLPNGLDDLDSGVERPG